MKILPLLGCLTFVVALTVGAQATEFGNLLVTQNDAENNTTSVTVVKGTGCSPNFDLRAGSNRGDYNLTFGTANDYQAGVVVASVSENGRNNNAFGSTVGTFYTTVSVDLDSVATPSRYYLALFQSPNESEQNVNVACAFLPYTQWLGGAARNSLGTNTGVTDNLQASAGINLGTQFTTLGSGLFGLDLTSIDAGLTSQNGILLVNHLKNEDNYAASRANANGTFSLFVRDNGSNGTANEQDPIAFAYLRTSDVGTKFLKAIGRVNSDASTDVGAGTFTVTKGGVGQWFLSIPGMGPDKGVLIVSPEGGGTNNTDNIVSYQWDPTNSRYVIESRDIVSTTAVPVLENGATSAEDMFSFAFFEAPIVPVVTVTTPVNGASYVTGTAFDIEGTAVDGDGTVTQVELLRDGVVVGIDDTAPYAFSQTGLSPRGYSFALRATDNDGYTVTSAPVRVAVSLNPGNLPANTALWFDGVNDHVTMGVAPELGVGGPPNNGLTVECWFRRDGAGTTASSGSGGISVVPLIARGRGETDGSNLDCNYLFGITTTGLLAADFETYPATGLTAGQNYPITGSNAAIGTNTWHHAAVTYDGATSTWTLYLDGVEVGTSTVAAGALPRYDSIQHFGLATAMNSTGVTQGAFHGAIDEARIWDHARTAQQIASFKDLALVSAPGLLGRFGLNEGQGTTTANSAVAQPTGTLVNGPIWINGANLQSNEAPTAVISAPANNASFTAPAGFTVTATAADTDGTVTKVGFFLDAVALGEDNSAPFSAEVAGLAQGSYTLTAVATDNLGVTATSAPVTVVVGPPNTIAPTVTLTAPVNGASFLAPANILLTVDAEDTDGSLAKVEFFNGLVKLGEDTSAPYAFEWSGVVAGQYTLTARATDNLTAATTSAAAIINVAVNQPPTIQLTTPADVATAQGASGSLALAATVTDPETQPLTVTFYGRLKSPPPGPDFTVVAIPDTQFYSQNTGGTRLANFTSQTNWMVSQRTALNIAFVAHVGDMVQNGDSVEQEWINANTAMSILENPVTTTLPFGIPWGGAPGNHDQQPIGSSDGGSLFWNQYFGTTRWAGRPTYGGNFGTNNDNNYHLFSASGLDFVVVNLEYRASASQPVLDWADSVLKAFPNRRAIVTSHWLIGTGNPANWGGHGQAVYDNLKDNPNLFLMICGHIHGEGQRSDTFEGRTVHTVLQDYQSRANGGDSWLRYFVFSPANNTISARTIQTTTGTLETDTNSQFSLPYTMGAGTVPWVELGTVAAAGGTASVTWTGLEGGTEYEWYAAVTDGTNAVGSTERRFTAAVNAAPTVSLTAPIEAAMVNLPTQVAFAATAADGDGSIAKVEFFANGVKVGEDSQAPYALNWTAISGAYALTAVAVDNQGAPTISAVVNITVANPSNQLPTVQLTAPANGARLPTTRVPLTATAADTDGVVAKVEFFDGATKLAEDTTAPYAFEWTGGAAGPHTLTAVATDNDGGVRTSSGVAVTLVVPETVTMVAKGSAWKYLDNGTDQGTAWRATGFDDSLWAAGPGPLGYGDTHIVTTINSGPSGNRIITTYLRRTFEVADASRVVALALNLLRDDGAVIYINGTEVVRSNIPTGTIGYLTNAAGIIDAANETTYVPLQPASLPLVNGMNHIAVEVHNRDGASSDLGFDLELVATQMPPPPTPELVVTEINSNGAGGDFWELTNVGSNAVDLGNWKWIDGGQSLPAPAVQVFPVGTMIAPGETIVIITDTTVVTNFLTAWGPLTGVQRFVGGPELGQNDSVRLYDSGDNLILTLSYAAAGFTRSDGSAAVGGHAGVSAGGVAQQSAVLDPAFGTGAGMRYRAATAGVDGAYANPSGGSNIGSPGVVEAVVTDDATVEISDASVVEGNSGSTVMTFTVSRSHNRGAFTVQFATTDGSASAPADYTAATGTLTFTANGDLSQTVSVTIIGDSVAEPQETFAVTLSILVNSSGNALLADATATGAIQNDDVFLPPSGALNVSNLGFLTLPFGAEIPAFDPASRRAFVSSGSGVQIVDLSNPAAPALVSTIAPASLGVAELSSNDVSSVAVRKGYGSSPAVLAAAIINSPKTQSGRVVFLNAATGALLGSVAVGAVPDNLTFTPDGSKLLVAIEGELDGTAADPTADTSQGGVAIIDVSAGFTAPTVTFANFTAYDSQVNALVTAGVRIFSKVVDVNGTPTRVYAAPSVDFECEYVAVSPDGRKAMVTLQEANAVALLDIATATFTSVVPLGAKDFSTLLADFSDRDGPGATASIKLTTGNPVFGMYMPDAIASYQVGGQVYYVTANEGDDRNDFLTPDETTTVGNVGYDLDDATFPNEAALKNQASLGRLVVSNASGLRGDTDGDGDIDRILSYGARSFSIHDANGTRVFDSADMIEKIVATQFPSNFFDGRSDNKGPEPEGVTVAVIGGRTYAFVGLERSHMVLIFDVTNPAAVIYAGAAKRDGDLNPEGLVVVPAVESPTGRALLLVTSEDSNTLSVFEIGQPAANFTMQLLHLSDGEAGLLASQTAPNLAALVDAFDDRYENTLIVSGGDNFIPSPFLNAGTDPLLNTVPWVARTNFARPDIAIHNLLGVEASAIGNHEWDLGSNVFMDAIRADGAWSGALFPHVSANLDYSLDSAALARFTDVPLNGTTTTVPLASAGASRLVPMAVVNKGGEKIGVLGVTTQILRAISSPSGTFAKGYPAGTTGVDNMDLLATQLQPYVNELIAEGVNKIVLLSHLQQIANEQSLATKLTGVDIIVAAGSNTRLGDADDVAVAFAGHAANFAGTYPLVTAGADSKPVLIVSTDNEFTYLGRLVVEFNTAGELITSNLASRVAENGSYAATTANVAQVWGVPEDALATTAFALGTKGARVKQVTDTVQTVINSKDGTVYGYTAVYLEGERVFVRGQETNLGNITADANQQALRAIVGGTAPIVSLKNGGGIRAQIGAVSSVGGSATKLPPPANPAVGKSEGGISQLDIENALRFNNRLMAFETTPAGLKAILEYGVASWPNQGRFPQIGGVAFAWDPARPAGSRVTSISLMNDDGTPGTAIYKEGPLSAAILRAAPPVIQMVTLNFLANDGDGYPMKANGSNFRYVLDSGALGPVIADESLNFTAAPQLPSNALGEQAAFASFLQVRHGNLANAFRQADTPASADERIQIATFRADTVPPLLTADSDGDGISDVLEDLIGLNAQSGIRIGETVALNLAPLAGSGSVLRLVGTLPAGLRFDAVTGQITGQLLGLPGSYPVQIQELVNGRIVATQWLNFEVAAFPAGLLGGFEVLLEDGSGTPRGIIRLTVARAGQWTGSLDLAGASRRTSRGTFTLVNGAQAAVNAVFPAARGIPATTVNLVLDAATPLVAGTYVSGTENGNGRGFRLVDRSSSVPMTQKLTMMLDAGAQDGVAYPAGVGWARGSAGVTGSVNLSGSLGDAQTLSLGLMLSRTGQAIVWSQPYRNKSSYVGGIVSLTGLGQPLPFPQRQGAGLRWFKAADSRELSYEAGFAAPLGVTAASSRWEVPANSAALEAALGLTASILQVAIDGAGLGGAAPVLPTAWQLSSKFALVTTAPISPAPVVWKGGVNKVDGSISGSLTLPAGAANLSGQAAASGVLLSDESFGTKVGAGLARVPISGKQGAFRTAAVTIEH
jgi:2',3'-cyclic-nucleotide 2'-phosphodiesterase (5'-nucleotidase family)